MHRKLTYVELEEKIKYLESKATLVDKLKSEIIASKNFLQILIDTIPNPVFYKDINGIYQNCNDAFSKLILGISKEKIIGKSLFDFPDVIPQKLAIGYDEKDKILFENHGTQLYESDFICGNDTKTFQIHKVTVEDELGEVVGLIGVMLDVTQFKNIQGKLDEKNRELKRLSYTDSLTGIFNRRKFDELFPKRIKVSDRHKHILNFVIIDVDNFKLYNDTYGHYNGDTTLKTIANSIKKRLLRTEDYLFRLGGEEFGILYHSNDEISSLKFSDIIRTDIEALEIEHSKNDNFGKVTISLGLTIIKNFHSSTKFIYEETDNLLYQAKKSGRNKLISKVI